MKVEAPQVLSTDFVLSGSEISPSSSALVSLPARFRRLVVNTIGYHFWHRDRAVNSSATSLVCQLPILKYQANSPGWLTVIGWIAALTSVCFFVADLVLQLVSLHDANFVRAGWHGTLLLWAMLLLCVFINIFVSGALPTIEVVVLIVHILGFVGIIVPLVYLTPSHNSAKEIFTTFHNTGGWSTHALAFFVGLQGNALAFVGTDSVVHVRLTIFRSTTMLTTIDV